MMIMLNIGRHCFTCLQCYIINLNPKYLPEIDNVTSHYTNAETEEREGLNEPSVTVKKYQYQEQNSGMPQF